MQEKNKIWRLNEFTIAGHVPLADPEYVKGLVKNMQEKEGQA
jgi:hypothetical protein